MAVAWQLEQAAKCPGCGNYLAKSTDPALEEKWEAYGVTCHSCAAAERGARHWTEASANQKGGDPSGMSWYSTLKEANDAR